MATASAAAAAIRRSHITRGRVFEAGVFLIIVSAEFDSRIPEIREPGDTKFSKDRK
jgi:hypothetical protein